MGNHVLQCVVLAWSLQMSMGDPPPPAHNYKLKVPFEDIQLVFNYIDRDHDGALTQADMNLLFDHHPEAAPDKTKFLSLLGITDGSTFNLDMFKKFMRDKTVTYTVYECSYVKPEALKVQCYEDRIVTYVHLVLTEDVVKIFYDSFNAPNGITVTEFKELFPKDQGELRENKAQKVLIEIAGPKDIASFKDFDVYVRQSDLHDDFRACKNVEGVDYGNSCLKNKLAKYATEELTEMDIAMIFGILDEDDDDIIGLSDIGVWCSQCDPDEVVKVIVTDPHESEIDYGEFRTFVKKSTVKIRIERKCLGEKKEGLKDKMSCFLQELLNIVSDHHKPIWLTLPTSDMLFLFEHMDVSNDGQIEIIEDLQKLGYSLELAKKFQKEMDGDDDDETVSLQGKEFNEYVGEPSVVFALAECKGEQRGPSRTKCYFEKLKDYITIIVEKKVIRKLFKSYDTDRDRLITEKDLTPILKSFGLVHMFLTELGMGDQSVNYAEFSWFVKHPEVSKMFLNKHCGKDVQCMQSVLLTYIQTKLTEYEIQQLFSEIDHNENWEIDSDSLLGTRYGEGKSLEQSRALIKKMDPNNSSKVNYEEFRTFLVTKGGKQHFEKKCGGTKVHSTNIDCYLQEIWNL